MGTYSQYEHRLRSVLAPALSLGVTAHFADDPLPVEEFPSWFVAVSSSEPVTPPDFASTGREQFRRHIKIQPKEIQGWLYRFDPEEDSRGWAWWDVTQADESSAHIWVDGWGESFFGCDDLRWLAYTAGAHRVEGPEIHRPGAWESERGDQGGRYGNDQ